MSDDDINELDLTRVTRITGLSIDDSNQVINEDGKVFFIGNNSKECFIYLRGYCQGSLDGIRESLDKFGVEVAP